MNNDAMRAALMAALPDHTPRENLARRISDAAEVKAMTDDDLETLNAEHEREITYLVGAIEARGDDHHWARRARQALRILRLHRHWIERERSDRKKKAGAKDVGKGLQMLAAAKLAAAKAMQETQRAAADARMARMAAANDEDRKQIAMFKAVAREVLGLEMYEHLWELTRQRLGQGS